MKRFYLFLQAVLLIALISCEPIEAGGEGRSPRTIGFKPLP